MFGPELRVVPDKVRTWPGGEPPLVEPLPPARFAEAAAPDREADGVTAGPASVCTPPFPLLFEAAPNTFALLLPVVLVPGFFSFVLPFPFFLFLPAGDGGAETRPPPPSPDAGETLVLPLEGFGFGVRVEARRMPPVVEGDDVVVVVVEVLVDRLERPLRPHLPPSGLAPAADCEASRTVTFSLSDSADPIASSFCKSSGLHKK